MEQAREILGDRPVQGNLDPCVLLVSRELIRDRTLDVICQTGSQGHIMNLGQGILPNTPEENVRCFFDTVRSVTCCS
jgi:uroporphyrinogen decarboxylase